MNDVQISGLEDVVDDISREKSKILLRSRNGWQGWRKTWVSLENWIILSSGLPSRTVLPVSNWIYGAGVQKKKLGWNMNLVKIYFHHFLSQKLSFRLQFKLLHKAFKLISFACILFSYLTQTGNNLSLCFLTALNLYFSQIFIIFKLVAFFSIKNITTFYLL